MSGIIIEGNKVAKELINNLKEKTSKLVADGKRAPCLAVILVGEDPASQVYVSHKEKHVAEWDIPVFPLAADTSQEQLESLIEELNSSSEVDGILVQLPLPKGLNQDPVINKISPEKDVDGLTSFNQGLLAVGKELHAPCTPKGIIKLLDSIGYNLEGKVACVIGRSILVGGPVCFASKKQERHNYKPPLKN